MRELAREGLEVLRDAPAERRAVLLEMAAFADFLVEQMPKHASRSGRRGAGARRRRANCPKRSLGSRRQA